MTKETIKFTTPATTLKELLAQGTDSDIANKAVAVASIIKAFTKNVGIVVSHEKCGLLHGEAWFYMRNTNEEERFNNATAYKVLVDLIDPEIKAGAFLWADSVTGGCIDGVHCDVIDMNFFGHGNGTGNQGGPVMTYARKDAEMSLNEAAERMKHGEKSDSVETGEHGEGWSKDDALDMEAGILEQAVEFGQFDED